MRRRLRKMCYFAGLCILIFFLSGCKEKETADLREVTEESTGESTKEDATAEPETQFVYICGAVANPGVYELPAGSRIYEAVEAAGGLTDAADQTYLNQARILKDEEQIYVPTQEETQNADGPKDIGTDTEDGKINLNTATKEELMTLAGIGESKADSIIRYREEHGKFQEIEDIMKIEGIKSGVFNKIKEQIIVK